MLTGSVKDAWVWLVSEQISSVMVTVHCNLQWLLGYRASKLD